MLKGLWLVEVGGFVWCEGCVHVPPPPPRCLHGVSPSYAFFLLHLVLLVLLFTCRLVPVMNAVVPLSSQRVPSFLPVLAVADDDDSEFVFFFFRSYFYVYSE